MSAPAPLSVEEWATRIRENRTGSVQAIVTVGRDLIEAKATLHHGEFEPMVRSIPMNPRSAQRYMRIAKHPVLSDATHASLLPPSWSTLAELARVDPKRVKKAIGDGIVHPEMDRHMVLVLARQKRGQSRRRPADAPKRNEEASWADCLFDEIPDRLTLPAYRALSKVLHPDAGGDAEAMKVLAAAWARHQERASQGAA